MAVDTDTNIKLYFETGDVPTQTQFGTLVDSKVNVNMEKSLNTEASLEILDKNGTLTVNSGQLIKDASGNTIADSNGKLPKALAYAIIFG